jgi:hypothetical protein
MEVSAAELWIRSQVKPAGPIEIACDQPWSTAMRVPLADGVVWFKACAPWQAFEPRLTRTLFERWPDRVVEVIASDEERGWLLLADAGTSIDTRDLPKVWLDVLPRYAELQRGEEAYSDDHLAHGVTDLRVETLPQRYQELLEQALPLASHEVQKLRDFAPRFKELCAELASFEVPASIQHDDLHYSHVYARGESLRVIDWGDASISHPFISLVVVFRFLEEDAKLAPDDPWFPRLRDAYLEPWGDDHADAFASAIRVGMFAHAFAWTRHREHMSEDQLSSLHLGFPCVLRRALSRIDTK